MAELKDVQAKIAKYEGEIKQINDQIAQLDDRKTQLLRIGYRIEGILAYLRDEAAQLAPAKAEAPAAEGGAEKPAAEAPALA